MSVRTRIGAAVFLAALFLTELFRVRAEAGASKTELSSVRILFGLTDTAPTRWDGTVSLSSGSVKAIQGVRFGPEDSTDYESSWTASTRALGNEVLENGIIITAAAAPDARWSIRTTKGSFSFTLRDLRWGEEKSFLDGAVAIAQTPPTKQLTTSDDDEYSPAIASSGEDIWLAFARFSHFDREHEGIEAIGKPLDTFDFLARPAGGDQVFAMRRMNADDAWPLPIPVSPKGETVAGVAMAIDGEKRPWVIWSAMREGNFDLFARRGGREAGWGPEIRITSSPGQDLKPVAATDTSGRVWIAWQGFRNNNLEVLACVQEGDRFSAESTVSFSPMSDWDPAIAAAPNGDVAVSWDTYDKGDYDVYVRRLRVGNGIEMDSPVAIAATPYFEARSSVAFDAHNRLWIAWETSTAQWGKNFGLYDTTGTPLYEDHDIRVKRLDGASLETTAEDLVNAMPGPPGPLRRRAARPNRNPFQPNPNQAKNRKPGQAVGPRGGSLNSSPRLAVDADGGVYLAFRTLSSPPGSRSPAGSIWVEHLAWFDGHKWVGPIFIPRSDGPLENAPALLARGSGHLLVITAMDHRQSIPQGLGADRINSDLYAADFRPGEAPASVPEMAALPPEPSEKDDRQTDAAIATVRNYRLEVAGQAPLKILRGDFHRHTEYSMDGTRDGSLEDAYRYMIDAASLDWGACCDTGNGNGHEYFWWLEQNASDEYHLGDRFTPLFGYERAIRYPEGHRVILFARRGIRPLPHLPPVAADAPPAPAPDTQMLYRYLRIFGGVSVPHSTTTDFGTDWRDSDPVAEPAVEIYEGQRQNYEAAGAPRAPSAEDAISGFHAAGFVAEALAKGYRLGFAAGSDHFSTHIAVTNVLAAESSREAIMDAFRKHHIFASTAAIVADVRSGNHIMGDEFEGPAAISVKLIGAAPFARVTVIKDGKAVYSTEPNSRKVAFEWTDSSAQPGKISCYYIRGEQADGNLVWVSPMWITPR